MANRLAVQEYAAAVSQFLLHLHPKKVPAETLRFSLSFGLGGISLTLCLLLAGSGLMQLMSYEPTVQGAHDSVAQMYGAASLAGWLRNVHYWASNLLVVSVGLHLLRVLCTDAFSGIRKLNWIIGTLLLLLVLLICFTGYLLPWSQLSYWAVSIFINMAGYIPWAGKTVSGLFAGGEVGQGTLSTFFVLHTGWLPLALIMLLGLHVWLIRKAGGLVLKIPEQKGPLVPVKPALLVREACVGIAAVALVFMLAALFDAPVGEPAMMGVSPNPVKAAWYFMGLQEMLIHFHPVFAVFVFPALGLLAFFSLPFWQRRLEVPATWFGGAQGRRLAVTAASTGAAAAVALVVFDALFARSQAAGNLQQLSLLSRGWLPLAMAAFGLPTVYLFLTRQRQYPKGEVILAAWLALFAGMATLTITGIWFRGPGMQLTLPF